MADVFISYHSTDENLAKHVHTYLLRERVKPFLACLSLQSGTEWEPSIRAELQRSPWVVLLASRAACASPYVLQEMGGAWLAGKQIFPVIWDMAPKEMPGFLKKYQVLDLRGGTFQHLEEAITGFARRINTDKGVGLLTLGALMSGALWAMSKSE